MDEVRPLVFEQGAVRLLGLGAAAAAPGANVRA